MNANMKSSGLLSGVKNIKSSICYSRKLDADAASKLMRDEKYIYNCAMEDVGGDEAKFDEYLSKVIEKKDGFIDNKIIWGRDELKETLKDIVEGRGGTFACLMGGKDIGKSLALEDIERCYLDRMFIVNLRRHPNILKNLVYVLDSRKRAVEEASHINHETTNLK